MTIKIITIPDEKVSLSVSTTTAPCAFCPLMKREEGIATCSKSGLKVTKEIINTCEKEGWRDAQNKS